MNARNIVPEGYKLLPNPAPPLPPTLAPLMAGFNESMGRGMLPPQEYGNTPSAQQSGYSIAGLSEKSANKYKADVLAFQQHLAAWGEQVLRFYRDNGHVMGDEGKRGSYFVPKQVPLVGQEPVWEVTPEMIDEAGTQVRVTLTPAPDAGQLMQLGNAFGLLRQQGIIGRRESRDLLGLPGNKNADQALKDIDIEHLEEMPEMQLARLLKYAQEELNDPDLAQFLFTLRMKGMAKEAASTAGTMNAALPPNPANQQPPQGGPPGGGPAQVPGLSLPGLGQPPGTQGGRPAGGPPVPLAPSGPAFEP
jgi:hypothetical protein